MNRRWLGPIMAVGVAVAVIAVLVANIDRGVPEPNQGAVPIAPGGPHGEGAMSHPDVMGVSAGLGRHRFMPMVAKDGPHYGATVEMPGHGLYRLIYHISPPDPMQFGRHNDPVTGVAPWFEPFSVEFQFDFQGVPRPDSDEARQRGVEVAPGFREYPIAPEEGYQRHHMKINSVWLPPIQMEGMMLPQSPNVIHLEADIRAAPGNPHGFFAGEWVPYLRVEYELTRQED